MSCYHVGLAMALDIKIDVAVGEEMSSLGSQKHQMFVVEGGICLLPPILHSHEVGLQMGDGCM